MGQRLRLLLVEDNPADVLWFRLTLDRLRLDYEVVLCETAKDALATLNGSHPHIVFVDLNLPGMSGEDFLRRMREKRIIGLPVCILTGSPLERERVSEEFGLDPRCYILKPISAETFRDALACFESTRSYSEILRTSGNNEAKSRGAP
jgi:CheY-like chemotaxis protein